MAAVASALRVLTLQLLRLQGRPMILAAKLRSFADPEFGGLHAAPQGQ